MNSDLHDDDPIQENCKISDDHYWDKIVQEWPRLISAYQAHEDKKPIMENKILKSYVTSMDQRGKPCTTMSCGESYEYLYHTLRC